MRCLTLSIVGIGILEVCIYSDRIREIRVRVGIDGIKNNNEEPVIKLILDYLMGVAKPQDVIKHIELSPGLLGLAQVAMLSIPRGMVATYAQIARLLNTSPRAAGRLASANKLPVIVPCHRVIKSDGSLGGYSVSDADVKSRLLVMEGVSVINGKVPRHYIVSSTVLMRNFKELLNHLSQGMVI